MENFFGLLETELINPQDFDSIDHFKRELIDYLDYYNNHRSKVKLKGLPPAIHTQQSFGLLTIYRLTNGVHFNIGGCTDFIALKWQVDNMSLKNSRRGNPTAITVHKNNV